ncbi:MAG: DUF3667 domain-containing protein [Cyclobacteriaceae bacterium]
MICISCKTDHNANFCPHCGEKSETKKITFKSITEDAFTTVTDMDKGFLYNCKQLFVNPKSMSVHYILGKRKGILNPISFLIISVTMYLIVESILRIPTENTGGQKSPEADIMKVGFAAGRYIRIYFKYFWILSIIPLAASTQLIFRKYNFTEHLAINSFILGQATLIGLVSYMIFKIDMPVNPLVYLLILWLFYRIFMIENDKIETFLMSFGALIIFIIQLMIITTAIGVIAVMIA